MPEEDDQKPMVRRFWIPVTVSVVSALLIAALLLFPKLIVTSEVTQSNRFTIVDALRKEIRDRDVQIQNLKDSHEREMKAVRERHALALRIALMECRIPVEHALYGPRVYLTDLPFSIQ